MSTTPSSKSAMLLQASQQPSDSLALAPVRKRKRAPVLFGGGKLPAASRTIATASAKNVLAIDLDNTILHCSPLEICSELVKHKDSCGEIKRVAMQRSGTGICGSCAQMTSPDVFVMFRRGLDAFLEGNSRDFDLVVYTHAKCFYARAMLNIIDPDGRLFKGRIVTICDAPGLKSMDAVRALFPAAAETKLPVQCIGLDDRIEAWEPKDRSSVVRVSPYIPLIRVTESWPTRTEPAPSASPKQLLSLYTLMTSPTLPRVRNSAEAAYDDDSHDGIRTPVPPPPPPSSIDLCISQIMEAQTRDFALFHLRRLIVEATALLSTSSVDSKSRLVSETDADAGTDDVTEPMLKKRKLDDSSVAGQLSSSSISLHDCLVRVQREVLKGCCILFQTSALSLAETEEAKVTVENSLLWTLVSRLGGRCVRTIVDQADKFTGITHIIVDDSTSPELLFRAQLCLPRIFTVRMSWIEACLTTFMRVSEESYLVYPKLSALVL